VVGTLECLAGRGVRLGLCTNKPGRATGLILEGLGLARLFEAVAGGDALPHRKPDGRHLAHVLERLGVEPGGRVARAAPTRAAMVGDNAHDVAVARACGVLSVAVSYGYPRMPIADLAADAVIDRFDELPAALGRLAGRAV
jgi:phosphoglycolate phosphatase